MTPTRAASRSLLAAIVFALAVATLPARAQTTAGRGRELRIPATVGDFRLVRQQAIDSAGGGGLMLRYVRADTLSADVFLYAGPDLATKCPIDCAHRLLTSEGDGFVSLVPMLIERKYADSASVRLDSLLPVPAGASWKLGRVIRLDMVRRGAAEWSEMFLFYAEGVRVKVRATYPRDPVRAAAIAAFAASAVTAVTGGDAPGASPP